MDDKKLKSLKSRKEAIHIINKELLSYIINNNPELKELYDSKRNELINESLIVNIESEYDGEEKEEVVMDNSKIKDPKIKSLFRKIVMETHPDRISDVNLNNIYIRIWLVISTHHLKFILMLIF